MRRQTNKVNFPTRNTLDNEQFTLIDQYLHACIVPQEISFNDPTLFYGRWATRVTEHDQKFG